MTDYTDAATVRRYVGLEDDDPDPDIEPAVAAANQFATGRDFAPAVADDPSFSLGAKLLAARLYKRKFTPEGVGNFGGDVPLYVARSDPEIRMLLGLDKPAVG
jgi:hypothetical protein